MLKISKIADYAGAVIKVFLLGPNNVYSATQVSASTALALPTVRKILKQLAEAGMLSSTQGPQGGYKLCGVPADHSVADLLRAVDGDARQLDCLRADGSCSQREHCSVSHQWHGVMNQVTDLLEQMPLDRWLDEPIVFMGSQAELAKERADESV